MLNTLIWSASLSFVLYQWVLYFHLFSFYFCYVEELLLVPLMSLADWNAFCFSAFLIVSLSYNTPFGGRILTREFPRGFTASPANAASHCVVNTSRAAWWLWVIVFLTLITLYRERVCRNTVKTLSPLPPALCFILTSSSSSFFATPQHLRPFLPASSFAMSLSSPLKHLRPPFILVALFCSVSTAPMLAS